jgi:hypothetical protein
LTYNAVPKLAAYKRFAALNATTAHLLKAYPFFPLSSLGVFALKFFMLSTSKSTEFLRAAHFDLNLPFIRQ